MKNEADGNWDSLKKNTRLVGKKLGEFQIVEISHLLTHGLPEELNVFLDHFNEIFEILFIGEI